MSLENREEELAPAPNDVGRKWSDEWDQGYYARRDDLCDAFALNAISRDQFLRGLAELRVDYYEARWMADQIRQDDAE